MKTRPFVTISLILVIIIITFVTPIFDSSIYGVNGHPTMWLSFMPNEPFRHHGLSLFLSPLIHLNFEHLMTNMILLIPIALMMERKVSGNFLIKIFLAIHFMVIIAMMLTATFFHLSGKGFLGTSHIIVGLYTFWGLSNKKYSMLIWPAVILAIGFWQSQNYLILLAHTLGLLTGVALFILSKLKKKLQTQK